MTDLSFKVDLEGKYICLYAGPDRGEARKVYKETMSKKEEFQSLFQTSGYSSRTMSKEGHKAHSERRETKPLRRKKRKSKESESE